MNIITLKPAIISNNYRRKWNISIHCNDYCHLYVNDKQINETLYRIGGFGVKLDAPYFMLLKQIESHYKDDRTGKKIAYIAQHATIINNDGIEKKVFNKFQSPYLYGVIYSVSNNYYNIETDELYCQTSSVMYTDNHLILSNMYDNNVSKRGVMVISKTTGEYTIIR